ncbi:MAG: metallophosphoesterase, partial [Candidatus Saccharimonadales bacterium]
MRLLALGDVHGCFDALTALEAAVALTADDLIVAVGDYVDRGPSSAAVLDWAIERQAAGRLVALRGNHERMMLDARHDFRARHAWLLYGGAAALESYAQGKPVSLESVPDRHWSFLEHECLNWFETETHFFVHANVLPNIPLDKQPEAVLLWQRFFDV